MTWSLDQSGTSFSGGLTLTDSGTGTKGTGSVSGSVSGNSITFSLSVPQGGADGSFTSCSATASGPGHGVGILAERQLHRIELVLGHHFRPARSP